MDGRNCLPLLLPHLVSPHRKGATLSHMCRAVSGPASPGGIPQIPARCAAGAVHQKGSPRRQAGRCPPGGGESGRAGACQHSLGTSLHMASMRTSANVSLVMHVLTQPSCRLARPCNVSKPHTEELYAAEGPTHICLQHKRQQKGHAHGPEQPLIRSARLCRGCCWMRRTCLWAR